MFAVVTGETGRGPRVGVAVQFEPTVAVADEPRLVPLPGSWEPQHQAAQRLSPRFATFSMEETWCCV